MSRKLIIGNDPLSLAEAERFVFERESFSSIEIEKRCLAKVAATEKHLLLHLERGNPVYGVNTGFGDSCHRVIPGDKAEQLQKNLIAYLLCGTGDRLPREAVRAMCLFRLQSVTRGYSGVSTELVSRLALFLERDWLPVVPCQGSLGASGDLIPLAYLAEILQGEGKTETPQALAETKTLLADHGLEPYRLKAKEGLALVNGTSSMAGLALMNLRHAKHRLKLATHSSAWLCLALGGRPEAFSELVNSKAKRQGGQGEIAKQIRTLLIEEGYSPTPLDSISIKKQITQSFIQDRYSLRCTPQVLGPVLETCELIERWLEEELNSVSDNPLIDEDGTLAMGGNFYGGYLSQGMDYLKISLGHVADLLNSVSS